MACVLHCEMILSLRLLAVLLALLSSACAGPRRTAPEKTTAPPQPIRVDWADPSFRATLPGGWSVRNCGISPSVLCVDEDGQPAGSIRLRDIPSLGEEKTTSVHQIQAVLAGRINSMYQFKIGRWQNACEKSHRVSTERPRKIAMGTHDAMKYELTGFSGPRIVERVVGYWAFRSGIETILEASAANPARCPGEPLGQLEEPQGGETLFTPSALARFERSLDRLVGGSRLPAPARFIPGEKPG